MRPFFLSVHGFFLVLILLFAAACSSKKETVASIGMQNLTARYNIIYNATELLKESEQNIEIAYLDDYEQLLAVYKEPTTISSQAELKNLDSVIRKMNFLVDEKIRSNYVDDAYFLKGRANYFKGDYFSAAEFFNYVYETYPDQKELRQASLAWKARALLQLGNLSEASVTLDSAQKNIGIEKKSIPDIHAVSAQYFIRRGKLEEAAQMLEQALSFEKRKPYEIRWTYLLAQLQERTGRLKEAYENYTKVIKSNATFEMAFNANLNRIHIEEEQGGLTSNQVERLQTLLKDNKSKEFTDQIHYRIAGIHQKNGQTEDAINSYNTSIQSSLRNQNQKGLAYAQLAEIYFKAGDYQRAKSYYDSTLTVLAPAYPNYEQIRLKSSNLDQLARSFQIINREDTLQRLARLPQPRRDQFIDSLYQNQLQRVNGNTSPSFLAANQPLAGQASNARFYFNNPVAVSQGTIDFIKRWGNRKLEDNWRRSSKSSAESVALAADTNANRVLTASISGKPADSTAFHQSYTEAIPLTAQQTELSNQKIVNAYYDIANFYKDVLKDDKEAIDTYLLLLNRYPSNNIKPAIYYNLYRLYSATDPTKSLQYRELLVREYPQTSFARIIVDPAYNQKADEQLVALTEAYNDVYELYASKKYTDVISRIAEVSSRWGDNIFSAQLSYLNALATGRTQKTDQFEASLQQLVKAYPEDKVVSPLARQHLEYIQANRESINKREFALVDFDPNEPRFIEPRPEPSPAPALAQAPVKPPVPPVTGAVNPPAPRPKPDQTVTAPAPAAVEVKSAEMFSLPDTSEYYFVVNVLNARTALSSSRFGIGQFNRSNYAGAKISHQLESVNRENQLIFVGPFFSRFDVERYQRAITPLMKDIMKIQAPVYNTFIITKEGLEKLSSREVINTYIDFYNGSRK